MKFFMISQKSASHHHHSHIFLLIINNHFLCPFYNPIKYIFLSSFETKQKIFDYLEVKVIKKIFKKENLWNGEATTFGVKIYIKIM